MRAGKKSVRFGLIALGLLIISAFLLMQPGLHDFRITLPNGYQLIRPSAQGNYIADPKSWGIIGPYVDRYRVVKHLVVGHVSPRPVFRGDTQPQEATGYFILDTKTGSIEKGMTKTKWTSTLKTKGVLSPPKLRRPNIFLAWLSKIGIE